MTNTLNYAGQALTITDTEKAAALDTMNAATTDDGDQGTVLTVAGTTRPISPPTDRRASARPGDLTPRPRPGTQPTKEINMAWGNRPRSHIPKRIKDQVRRRDKTCQLAYPGCTQRIDEMDHIIGLAAQGIPRTPVLSANEIQGVCRHCHAIKTQAQATAGRQRAIAQRGNLSRRYRNHEHHPGLMTE
ncbi:HNH endonuclease signature motif containing protein [Mycobacterium xenopi]|uniref:HNH endonuclease n=2 Tax=Mycobacterium xenopi TaxID=1789 RepID=A0AAD1H2M3_MYCXE|nr:HNH endonuclease signature motif containing protein [Mycobacterium xenopi]EUA34582.1 hypothetical protein I552_5365 [Mycobacterium xenopi 3993]MDA3639831.1 HNH endonuclease signature motif containing protein [Mycobacterium xenopi]MDA3658191.1 HNH endonuclease signature motif containing protein [Mycobacterium xenopi]MDA3661843.1 HNH endonuclease signature motif containing protein [Mycobacterium xenopi]ORX21439.1 hypothetical protein AWC32_23300 [Mycobacterium xenopi]